MKTLVQYIKEILFLLGDGKKKLPMLLLLFLTVSMLDLFGLGLIGPYISLVVNPDIFIHGKPGDFFSDLGFSLEINDLLISLGLILISIFLVKAIVGILIHRSIMRFIIYHQIKIQTRLMKGYQRLPYIDYMRRNSSEYINSIGSLVMNFTGGVLHNTLTIIGELMVGAVVISLLAYTNVLALATLIIMLGIVTFAYDKIFRDKMKNYGKRISDGHEKMLMGIQEGFGGFKEIRILGKNLFFEKIVTKGANYAATGQINSAIVKKAPVYLFEFIIIAFIVMFIIVFLRLENDFNTLIPTLGVFTVATLRMKPIANNLINGINTLRLGRYAVSYIYKDCKELESQLFQTPSYSNDKSKSFSSIILEDVSFQYPNTNDWALKNISISLYAGESIGLIGSSGSGKTTLLDVFLGLLEPQRGKILYNNYKLDSFVQEWQGHVAYLPQEIFIFDDTLKQNIALAINDEAIDNKQINNAISQAKLKDFVDQLPQGIETILGEHGVRLSGGQRQRVAIARAFYHKRSVLVMDEATSSLDDETEQEIVAEINRLKKKKTIIVIAHRLSTVKHCDRIYRLEKGKIIETGSYEQIINKKKVLNV